MKMANFTLHEPTQDQVRAWAEFGFELDPAVRAPLVDVKTWEEAAILSQVASTMEAIYQDGFHAVLIGGLTNVMCYAWMQAERYGIQVITAQTERTRDENGNFSFHLAGFTELLTPAEVIQAFQ